MTRNKILLLSFGIVTIGLLVYFKQHLPEVDQSKSTKKEIDKSPSNAGLKVMPHPVILDGEVITTPPAPLDPFTKEVRDVEDVSDDTPKEHWEHELISSIRAQGGSRIKSVRISKVEKKKWKENKMQIEAQSVVVSIKNDQGVETTYRALIDPASGRVLQTWDQPVIDPINPREEFGIGLDPRYHQKSP